MSKLLFLVMFLPSTAGATPNLSWVICPTKFTSKGVTATKAAVYLLKGVGHKHFFVSYPGSKKVTAIPRKGCRIINKFGVWENE